MFTIVSIVIGIVFFFLLGKAILETIWGSCLIVYGVLWQIVGCLLLAAAWIIDKIYDLKDACKNPNTNACKMWAARATLTVLIIALLGSIIFLTYKSLWLISMIDWQTASDWIHTAKAILIDAIKN